ncbi:hypothetical protein [Paenibacillus sp. TSA_86.1]|uniref:hypothetical protein n=1 Tax=Paenibacillus sp. TSA_86.1 TaxID=3415649 RepID=UPI004045E24D
MIEARKPPSIKGERSAPPAHHDAFAPASHGGEQKEHLPAGLGQMYQSKAGERH